MKHRILEVRALGIVLRIFPKPWGRPYHWNAYGLTAFGMGPIGFMFWGRRPNETLPVND